MGCVPLYALYDITIPRISESWIKRFFDGTRKQHKVSIIGGDTTKGPMSISITLIGVKKNKIITRSGAKTGHDIYITGNIGSARAALILDKKTKGYKYFRKSLVNPLPRVSVGLELSEFASSCIDISDGLIQDLGHILDSSEVGGRISSSLIPVSEGAKLNDALFGGDDYQLLCTSPNQLNCFLLIGVITQELGIVFVV